MTARRMAAGKALLPSAGQGRSEPWCIEIRPKAPPAQVGQIAEVLGSECIRPVSAERTGEHRPRRLKRKVHKRLEFAVVIDFRYAYASPWSSQRSIIA